VANTDASGVVKHLTLVAQKDSPVFAAETLADLKGFTFGAVTVTNNATYIDEVIQPDQPLVALLPDSGHDMGMVFEKGAALVHFVNQEL
jgi:hypothetical protein